VILRGRGGHTGCERSPPHQSDGRSRGESGLLRLLRLRLLSVESRRSAKQREQQFDWSRVQRTGEHGNSLADPASLELEKFFAIGKERALSYMTCAIFSSSSCRHGREQVIDSIRKAAVRAS
jgi:hypothetical protein